MARTAPPRASPQCWLASDRHGRSVGSAAGSSTRRGVCVERGVLPAPWSGRRAQATRTNPQPIHKFRPVIALHTAPSSRSAIGHRTFASVSTAETPNERACQQRTLTVSVVSAHGERRVTADLKRSAPAVARYRGCRLARLDLSCRRPNPNPRISPLEEIRKPVTSQVTTTPGNASHATTGRDGTMAASWRDATPSDRAGRSRHASHRGGQVQIPSASPESLQVKLSVRVFSALNLASDRARWPASPALARAHRGCAASAALLSPLCGTVSRCPPPSR